MMRARGFDACSAFERGIRFSRGDQVHLRGTRPGMLRCRVYLLEAVRDSDELRRRDAVLERTERSLAATLRRFVGRRLRDRHP
jgi:hypothetical protein